MTSRRPWITCPRPSPSTLDLDTSKAEAAATAFIEKMEKQGLIFQTTAQEASLVLHEGGPAGHATRFATGRPRSDEVDARLQKGEFVVSRQGVQNMGGMGTMSEFHDFIQGKRLFHDGGPVDESEEVAARIAKAGPVVWASRASGRRRSCPSRSSCSRRRMCPLPAQGRHRAGSPLPRPTTWRSSRRTSRMIYRVRDDRRPNISPERTRGHSMPTGTRST